MRRLFLVLTLLLVITTQIPAQDRSYGRSMVVTNGGIAATSQYLASQVGANILRRGGSAIDAAIAANAVLVGKGQVVLGDGPGFREIIGGVLLQGVPEGRDGFLDVHSPVTTGTLLEGQPKVVLCFGPIFRL